MVTKHSTSAPWKTKHSEVVRQNTETLGQLIHGKYHYLKSFFSWLWIKQSSNMQTWMKRPGSVRSDVPGTSNVDSLELKSGCEVLLLGEVGQVLSFFAGTFTRLLLHWHLTGFILFQPNHQERCWHCAPLQTMDMQHLYVIMLPICWNFC